MALSLPPRVGIYGPILRGRHAKSLQASILRSCEDDSSKTASGRGADEDHDQNNRDFEDYDDSKLVSSVVLVVSWFEISYVVCFCFSYIIQTRCDFSITPQAQAGTGTTDDDKSSVLLEETTTSRQYSDAANKTFDDHVVSKGGHPVTSDTTYRTNNRTGADFFQGPPGDATSDDVPCPPPLHRWTGYSTRFNSYESSLSGGPFNPSTPFATLQSTATPFASLQSPATPASADLDSYLGSFCDTTTTGNLAFDDSFESSGEKYPPHGILDTPSAADSGNFFGSHTGSDTQNFAPEATATALSPVTEISTMLAHVGPIDNVVSSDINDDAMALQHLSIPPNVLPPGSRIVQTPDGLAVLLSSLQTSVHPVARSSAPRQFQHWTDEEDALLKNAAAIEGGPPLNWKKISRKYFLGSRTDTQCKGRWKKVRERLERPRL
jgi:hypothetical protein